MNSKQVGNVGVAQAIASYVCRGYEVLLPLGDNCRYDLVVEKDDMFQRVQVKTTRSLSPYGIPVVRLTTQGGNRSWNGVVKHINSDECDLVFVHIVGGRSYEFPVEHVVGKYKLNLGSQQEPFAL